MLQKLGIKAKRFDLHCHTPASDGSKELIDLLTDAENAKLDVISFTDHDTLDIYEYLKDIDYKKWYSGKIIYGVEITVEFQDERYEVLAYNFDYEKLRKYKYFQKTYDEKVVEKQTQKLVDKARKMGFVFEPVKEKETYRRPCIWGPVYSGIMANKEQNEALIKKYKITDGKHFCRVLFSQKGQPFYLKANYIPSIKKICKIVHKCGGVCIFAHPFNYGAKNVGSILERIRSITDIDGIECAHSAHTKEQIKYLVDYCDKYDLMKTAGSDFHGRERFYENGLYNFKFGYLGAKGDLKPITDKTIGYKWKN